MSVVGVKCVPEITYKTSRLSQRGRQEGGGPRKVEGPKNSKNNKIINYKTQKNICMDAVSFGSALPA